MSKNSTLALSNLHLRIEELEKQHQWLLKQIKKKQTELRNFVEQMRSVALEMYQKTSPLMQEMLVIDQDIHHLFDLIFNHPNRKFGKKAINDIRELYENLQRSGIISPEDEEDEDQDLDELFKNIKEDENSEDFQNFQSRFYQPENEELGQETKKNEDQEAREIRQTFLKLASIFHPDKVSDESSQKIHTQLMQEINKAYQEGDLARLLEIEQKYEIGEEIDSNNQDDLTRQCNRLEKRNESLRQQYEEIKQELRLVKNTSEGELVSDYRRAKREKVDLIAMMLEQLEKQLNIVTEIRNFVRDFQQKKITVNRFLEGPDILQTMRRDLMAELLSELFDEMDEDDEYDFF